MLTATLSLGVWQVSRLHWKRGLLAELERGETVAPTRLSGLPLPYSRVIAEGEFLPGVARYGAEVRATSSGASMGAHVLGVLRREDDLPVVVDRGWAPVEWSAPMPSGLVHIEGYVRPKETAAWSSASDDPAGRRFFTLDAAAIGASLGVMQVAPFTLVALGSGPGYPEPVASLPRPPNDHLSYAITWFSLSAVLVIVFAVFARQTMSKAPRP